MKNKHLLSLKLLIAVVLFSTFYAVNVSGQAIVVNEYFNGFSQKTDWVELLVIQSNTDLRNFTLRDFSSSGNPQTPLRFSNNPYWANLPAGMLIVITGDSSIFVQDTAKVDFSILIKKTVDSTYLSGNQFNIAVSSDAIQIRTVTDTLHVHGIAHGSANQNTIPSPKAYYPNQLSGGYFTIPAGASLFFTKSYQMTNADFGIDGNLGTDTVKGGSPGKPNDFAGNWKYILSLRSASYNPNVRSLSEYIYKSPKLLGSYAGRQIFEGSLGSGMSYIYGSDRQFWMITDRGPNVDAEALNGGNPAKIFAIPSFTPKIYKVQAQGDSIVILDTIAMKRPTGIPVTGFPNSTYYGTLEIAYSDSGITQIPPDDWGIDSEGILRGPNNTFWVCDEYGASVWQLNSNGQVINRYRPFPASTNNIQIDSIIKYRKNNRGFEGVAITPNGKIYAMVQSALNNPNSSAGNNSKAHRLLELDPTTNTSKTFLYFHEPTTAQVRDRDYKIGDLVAINNTDFLVLEHAARNGDYKMNIFRISLTGATPVTQELFGTRRIEQLPNDSITIITGYTPVQKTLYLNMMANGWDYWNQDKPEGLTIINDSTFALANDNDFGIVSNDASNGNFWMVDKKSIIQIYTVSGTLKISGLILSADKQLSTVPRAFELNQNFPNPFNPVTKIKYSLPQSSLVKLVVFDVIGREVQTLINNEQRTAGSYIVNFDGKGLSSGVYFYKLEVTGQETYSDVKKMMLVK